MLMQFGREQLRLLLSVAALLAGFAVVAILVARSDGDDQLERHAEEFVMIALSLGQPPHAEEVDAYFGPQSLGGAIRKRPIGSDVLLPRARALLAELQVEHMQEPLPRRARLSARLRSFVALLEALERPRGRSFDEEAGELYATEVKVPDVRAQQAILRQLETLLPGDGPLAQRVAAYRERFVVPDEKRRAIFDRALDECRMRTRAHWLLPDEERLDIEWTRKVDAAWHRYEGRYRSRLQINPSAVAYLASAVDIACHEGYPGHHAQFVLMEAAAEPKGLPVEDTVVLLRSPASILREGAAEFGVELSFPAEERLAFTRDVLFPMAGFAPEQAEKYTQVHRLTGELAFWVLPTLRSYRDRVLPFSSASSQLESEALISSPESLLKFVDDFGAYVLGYTVARDRVRAYVHAQSMQSGDDHWAVLRRVLVHTDVSLLDSGSAPGALSQPPLTPLLTSSVTASNLHESKP